MLMPDLTVPVWLKKLTLLGGNLADGARFEASASTETIGLDLVQSFSTQSLTEDSETEEEQERSDVHLSSAEVEEWLKIFKAKKRQ